MMHQRHFGKFRVTHLFLDKFPEEVMQFMSDVLVLRAESNHYDDSIHYHAWSKKHFREIKPGGEMPEYTVNISRSLIKGKTRLTFSVEEVL